MAQIVWAVTGSHPGGPKFYLLNANGPTMLRRAVRYAIEQKVDVILFSGSFEGGGNGDGRGPDQPRSSTTRWPPASSGSTPPATTAGASTTARCASSATATSGSATGRTSPPLRFRNRLDENTVTVTLTWNDYRDEEDAGTDKDLDLYVEDWAGRRVGAGEKVQVAGDRAAGPGREPQPPRARRPDRPAASPDVPPTPTTLPHPRPGEAGPASPPPTASASW